MKYVLKRSHCYLNERGENQFSRRAAKHYRSRAAAKKALEKLRSANRHRSVRLVGLAPKGTRYAIYDTFANIWASREGAHCWAKVSSQILTFPTWQDAKTHATIIKNGPRQFAGLGQRTKVVRAPKGTS